MLDDLKNENIKLQEEFVVRALIEKLSELWRNYKQSLKHKRKHLPLEDVIVHIIIEEKNKNQLRAAKAKVISSKDNLVDEKPNPRDNRNKGLATKIKNLIIGPRPTTRHSKRKENVLFVEN